MPMETANLLDDVPERTPAELVTLLASADGVRIERIVSQGQVSPPGFWYDQPQHEWVAVLEGNAIVEFADGQRVEMRRGSWLNIPAHARHRVAWTNPAEKTIWLAVHYGP